MDMNRRGFLRFLGGVAVTMAVAPHLKWVPGVAEPIAEAPTIAFIDTSSMAAILKEMYGDDTETIRNLIYHENHFLEMIPKANPWVGAKLPAPLWMAS